MIKRDKSSDLYIIEDIADVKELLSNRHVDFEFSVKLSDDNEKNKMLLKEIENNVDDLKMHGYRAANIIVPYEKIEREMFVDICNSYISIKDKFYYNFSVDHRFINKKTKNPIELHKRLDWDINTIVKVNLDIDNVCLFIKNNNFTPFEALAFIHQYVGSLSKYNSSRRDNRSWIEKDQTFAGMYLDVPEVVCMGYCSLMKEIIDHLNMPGLDCEIATVGFLDHKNLRSEKHARCFVKISDKKYGIRNEKCFCDVEADKGKTFTGFAMSNKCHENDFNKRFNFEELYIEKLFKDEATIEVSDINLPYGVFDKLKTKPSQSNIEKAYFTTFLTKTSVNKETGEERQITFEEAYSQLEQMTAASYHDQIDLGYVKGYIKSEEPMLSKEEAKNIYKERQKLIPKQMDQEMVKRAEENKFLEEAILGK